MFFVVQEKHVNRPNIPLDHACTVCGAPASAHHHYGAVVCYPCRAFFRRGTTKNFQCRTGKFSCPLEQAVKNRCRGCRYEKCLQVGMKPAMVDATLVKKNINGAKKKGKRSHELLIEGDNDPLDLSRASALPTGEEIFEDSSTQLFYVYNPPTQTYEPVTIISLGDDGVQGFEEHVIPHQAELMPHESQVLVNNIHTDHEEIVQTCEQVAGEVIVCNTYDSEVEREEIVDCIKEEYVGPSRPEDNQS